MNIERIRLLKELDKLEKERDHAKRVFCDHVAKARQFRINKILKRLEEIRQ